MKNTKREKKFSNKTIERLALYYEILITLPFKKKYISSEENSIKYEIEAVNEEFKKLILESELMGYLDDSKIFSDEI